MKYGKKQESDTGQKMAEYMLAEQASEDLIAIAIYGDEKYGIAQSNKYRDQLKQRFTLLAKHPLQYPAVDHVRPGYRRSICGAHSIFFRIDGAMVEIIRILGRQDLQTAF